MGSGSWPGAPTLTTAVLRSATHDDLAEIARLEGECYSDPWSVTAFASLPDNPRVAFLVAISDGTPRIEGYVVAWYVLDEGELANLAVVSTSRRRGIGRALLDAVLDDAKARGVGELYLEVRESNTAARALYASRDFAEVGRRKGYYRNPKEDALILRRALK